MKFICSKQDLTSAISTASKAVNMGIQKSILSCIHIETFSGYIVLRTTDTMLSIKTEIPAEISEIGRITVPARIFQEIVSKLPDDDITIESVENNLKISCRSFNTSLMLMDVDEFPDFPFMEETSSITMEPAEFKKMSDSTIFAAYLREDKPLLTGELIECKEGKLSFVALDGVRIAIRSTNTNFAGELKAVVPARAMKEITKTVAATDGNIKICFGDRALMITAGQTEIYTRLLEGDYIDYNKFISKTYSSRVRVETGVFKEAMDRIMVIAKERDENPINLDIDAESMIINANSEYGTGSEEIPVLLEGEDVKMSFNAKYMQDVLKNITESEIMLEFGGNLKPCVIRPVNSDDFIYLIVPRIR